MCDNENIELESEQPLKCGQLFTFTKGNYKITTKHIELYIFIDQNEYLEIKRVGNNENGN